MKKSVWISMIVAGACILAGLACVAVGHGLGGHRLLTDGSPGGRHTVTVDHAVADTFDRISVDVRAADVTFSPSENGECRVVTVDEEKMEYAVTVESGTLTVTVLDKRDWHERLFSPYEYLASVTVYLPATAYESLQAHTLSGRIEVSSAFSFAEDVRLAAVSGSVSMAASVGGHTDVKTTSGGIDLQGMAGSLTAKTSSGSLRLENLTVEGDVRLSTTSGGIHVNTGAVGSLTVDVGSGSVTLEDLTVTDTLAAETTSGSLSLTRVTCKSFTAETTSGRIELTDSKASGHISAETTSGSIRLTRADAATLRFKTTSGSVRGTLLTQKVFRAESTSGSIEVPGSTEGGLCEIRTTSGSIHITIEE